MKKLALKAMQTLYTVRERDLGEDHILKKNGMTFTLSAYDIEGFGSMSVIEMSAMLGLMKMESFILTAEEKDLPLFNGDYIQAAGKCTLLEEFYDTMITPLDEESAERYRAVKARYDSFPAYKTEPRWYDDIRYDFTLGVTDKRLKDRKKAITADYLKAYLANIRQAPACDPAVKKAKTKAYAEGLLTNGGPAVDQFRKLFGEEKTRRIFEEIIFSCG
ncbi:MAG: hypothetical protein IKF16_07240 [Lachnospiraceae bacterium]|nr:hypothetical protein [Lachnospiraceae bacterium]